MNFVNATKSWQMFSPNRRISFNIYFLEKYVGLSQWEAFSPNWSILQTRMNQKGNHTKINFDYF